MIGKKQINKTFVKLANLKELLLSK